MPSPRALSPVIWGTILCLPLLACGGDDSPSSPSSPPPPPPAATYDISIINGVGYRSDSNLTQNPSVDTVVVGTKVRWLWRNTGTVVHNVTGVGSPTFAGSPDLSASATWSYTFAKAGTYHYECTMPGHAAAGMIGTIVVK